MKQGGASTAPRAAGVSLKLHGQTDLARAAFTAVQVLGETVGEARATKHLYILNGMGHGDVM